MCHCDECRVLTMYLLTLIVSNSFIYWEFRCIIVIVDSFLFNINRLFQYFQSYANVFLLIQPIYLISYYKELIMIATHNIFLLIAYPKYYLIFYLAMFWYKQNTNTHTDNFNNNYLPLWHSNLFNCHKMSTMSILWQ